MSKLFLIGMCVSVILLLCSIVGKILSGKKMWQYFIYVTLFFSVFFSTVYILFKTVIS